jgi:AcrR family transcriptional regulator
MTRNPEATRKRIIRAALKTFLNRGYDGASLNEIARNAGVTKGGLYHHFESKGHLFREALRFITGEMEKWSFARFRRYRSSRGLLRALFGSMLAMRDAFSNIVGEAAGRPLYTFLEILVSAARRDNTVREEMARIYGTTRRNIAEALRAGQAKGEIRRDIDTTTLAFEINALLEGTILLSLIDQSVDLDRAGRKLFASVWGRISE